MKLYRIEFELKSPIVTPLKGDTIWGHFAWGIANHEGDEGIAKFIEDCKKDSPSFVISSAFPHGYICKQMHEPAKPQERETLTSEKYAQIKVLKKRKYEQASLYLNVAEPTKEVQKKVESGIFMSETHAHNSISRVSGTVNEGSLYAVEELWSKEKCFDLYVLSDYSKERILEIARWAFENGFGADSSTGKGAINLHDCIEEVAPKKQSKKYMALAPFIVPDMNKIEKLRADIFVRSGKIGGAFVSSLAPWKKSVVLYDEGAVFESTERIEYIGTLLSNMHADKRIVQSAFAPVIPI